MIEKNKNFGYFEVYCDEPNCESYDTYDTVDWYDAVQEMKEEGWKVVQFNGSWRHICPDCGMEI